MRIIREYPLGARKVMVKELTVGEIRAWLAGKVELGDLVDTMLFEELALSDLEVLTDLTAEDIEQLAPSEIEALQPALREVNARFFAMREKVAMMGRQILAQQKNASPT